MGQGCVHGAFFLSAQERSEPMVPTQVPGFKLMFLFCLPQLVSPGRACSNFSSRLFLSEALLTSQGSKD